MAFSAFHSVEVNPLVFRLFCLVPVKTNCDENVSITLPKVWPLTRYLDSLSGSAYAVQFPEYDAEVVNLYNIVTLYGAGRGVLRGLIVCFLFLCSLVGVVLCLHVLFKGAIRTLYVGLS